jgi:hypothetical protein
MSADPTEVIPAVAESVSLPSNAEHYIVLARYSGSSSWTVLYDHYSSATSQGNVMRDEARAFEVIRHNQDCYSEFKVVRVTLPIR